MISERLSLVLLLVLLSLVADDEEEEEPATGAFTDLFSFFLCFVSRVLFIVLLRERLSFVSLVDLLK